MPSDASTMCVFFAKTGVSTHLHPAQQSVFVPMLPFRTRHDAGINGETNTVVTNYKTEVRIADTGRRFGHTTMPTAMNTEYEGKHTKAGTSGCLQGKNKGRKRRKKTNKKRTNTTCCVLSHESARVPGMMYEYSSRIMLLARRTPVRTAEKLLACYR